MALLKLVMGSAVVAALLSAAALWLRDRLQHRAELERVDREAWHRSREASRPARQDAHRLLQDELDAVLFIARWQQSLIQMTPPAQRTFHQVRRELWDRGPGMGHQEREVAFLASRSAAEAAAAAVEAAENLSSACLVPPVARGDTSCEWYAEMVDELAGYVAAYRDAVRVDIGATTVRG